MQSTRRPFERPLKAAIKVDAVYYRHYGEGYAMGWAHHDNLTKEQREDYEKQWDRSIELRTHYKLKKEGL